MTLRDHLRVVRRRKWLIVLTTLLVTGAAVALSLRQERLFQASAEIFLNRNNLAATLAGTQDPSLRQTDERFAETQVRLGRVPDVAQRVLDAEGITDRTAENFLSASTIEAVPNADLLEFRVTDPVQGLAARLATEYARQFAAYRQELDTAAVQRAKAEIDSQIAALKVRNDAASPAESQLYADLIDKRQQLATLEALQTSNTRLVRPADEAAQVQPKPIRNGILAFALGLVLGVGVAFLFEALDTRVRSAEEISERLHLPLLARLPEPPRQLRKEDRLVTLEEPNGIQAEAFRMLRTSIDFVNLDRGARTIMVTSAGPAEGKSTTVANLAVALARSGRRIALVDFDLRRPLLDRFFKLEGAPGVTNVLLGRATLDQALAHVALTHTHLGMPPPAEVLPSGGHEASSESALDELIAIRSGGPQERAGESRNGGRLFRNGHQGRDVEGMLEVVPSGPVPPNPGELVGSPLLGEILTTLSERADLVLVDAPPLLHVGDAATLSGAVDALVVVTHLKLIRRATLSELHRVLEACPASKLGFVLAGAELEEGYGYGYGYGYYSHADAGAARAEKDHAAA